MKRKLLAVGIVAIFTVAGTALAAGDAAAGKTKAAACSGCHGKNGEGVKPNPALAGLAAETIIQDLKDYKSGKRANPVMKTFASKLSDADMANLAAYYASLKK